MDKTIKTAVHAAVAASFEAHSLAEARRAKAGLVHQARQAVRLAVGRKALAEVALEKALEAFTRREQVLEGARIVAAGKARIVRDLARRVRAAMKEESPAVRKARAAVAEALAGQEKATEAAKAEAERTVAAIASLNKARKSGPVSGWTLESVSKAVARQRHAEDTVRGAAIRLAKARKALRNAAAVAADVRGAAEAALGRYKAAASSARDAEAGAYAAYEVVKQRRNGVAMAVVTLREAQKRLAKAKSAPVTVKAVAGVPVTHRPGKAFCGIPAYQLPETQVSVPAVTAAAKLVGRAVVEATSVDGVFEALRKNPHRFDNGLGKLLCAVGLKTLEQEQELATAPVNTVTNAIDVLFGKLPADTKERATSSLQRKAAVQAFRALKAGAFDLTTSHWASTALVGNARLFAACCGFRLLGDTVAEAPASGVNPANEIDFLAKTAGEETGETEGDEALVFTGKVDPDTLEEATQPAGYEEVSPSASDAPEGINWAEWTMLSTANSDREVSMAKGHEAHWDELFELYTKTKVVSKEAEFREAVSAADEVYNLSLFDGLDQ